MKFIRQHYAFHWFSDKWSEKQKWLYVAVYVTFFNLGLIPLLSIAEKTGVLEEGSLGSLGNLLILLLLWFALYQPIVNFMFSRRRKA
jgi:hypothetical protein